jgi:calcium/calmodulin-dependent protein kinase I
VATTARCQADLWGLGVILHVMLTCTMPFGDDEESQRVVDHLIAQAKGAAAAPDASLMQGSAWQQVSAGAKGLVAGLLTPDASKRFTVQDAWQHAWMKTVDPPDSSQLAVNPLTKKLKWRQKPSDVVVDLR